MTSPHNIIKKYVKPTNTLILAISGGPDSVYLLDILIKLGLKPILAHLNHKLRGRESDKDEEFVIQLANKYSLKIETESIKTLKKTNLEANLRKTRYEFLEKIRKKHKAKYILTAHHLNDNLETAILNFTRGCMLCGLSGMQIQSGKILRPLLQTTKEEILTCCKKEKLRYRIDKSNKDLRFSRNLIRHKIIPQLKKINPEIEKTFLQNQENFRQIENFLNKKVQNWIKTNFKNKIFKIEGFIKLHPAIQKQVLKEIYLKNYGSTENLTNKNIEEVMALIHKNKTGTRKKFGAKVEIKIAYGKCKCGQDEQYPQIKQKRLKIPGKTKYEYGTIITAFVAEDLPSLQKRFHGCKPPDQLLLSLPSAALYVRSVQKGDKISPLGLKGTKKLQDIFTDKKIPKENRTKIPIFATKKEIIAIGALNIINEEYKITKLTEKILEINIYKV